MNALFVYGICTYPITSDESEGPGDFQVGFMITCFLYFDQ